MTSAPMSDVPLEALSRALDQFTALAAEVTPEQEELPTPCRSWDVRTLLAHLVEGSRKFTAAVRDEPAPAPGPGGGGDTAAEMRAAGDELISAWRVPGALDKVLQLPFGERPASWRVGQQTVEFTVHGWDLAHALGRDAELDPQLAEVALVWGRENLKPEFRGDEASGKVFGAEVHVPDGAEPYTRLAAFFGRDPA